MAPQLLSDVWERWAPAIVYFYNQESFPFCDRAEFEKHICRELKSSKTIRLDDIGCQFIIDLMETSPDKFDIVAFSIIKFLGHKLTGGEVVTEFLANHARTSDHVELIRGMETVGITRGGKIRPMCCREDWMKNSQKDERHPRVIAETSRRKIVKFAKERKIQALKLPQMEPKKESSMTSTENQGVIDELNRNLSTLCKKAATLLALKGERKTIKVNENISTQEAISFMSKAIDDLQHWAPSEPFYQARGDKPSEKAASSKATARAQEEEIKNTKNNDSKGKYWPERDVEMLEMNGILLEMDIRIPEEKKQLEMIIVDLMDDVALFRSRAKHAEEKLKQLTVRNSDDANGEELAENNAHQLTRQLQEAVHQHEDRQEVIHKKVSDEEQGSPQSPSDDKTDNEELVIKDENFDEDALFEELAEELHAMANYEDVASKESGRQHRVAQLERELETTKEALKNKTDELASAAEQHARELVDARGSKGKCRCKDKEAYLESVEEHVENLRGTMEDVLRHVSTYQGRKRRRTEGPDFEH